MIKNLTHDQYTSYGDYCLSFYNFFDITEVGK